MKKYLLCLLVVYSSSNVIAEDLSLLLDENQCTPVLKADGQISNFECAGTLGWVSKFDESIIADSNDFDKPLSLDEKQSEKLKIQIVFGINGRVIAKPNIIS